MYISVCTYIYKKKKDFYIRSFLLHASSKLELSLCVAEGIPLLVMRLGVGCVN